MIIFCRCRKVPGKVTIFGGRLALVFKRVKNISSALKKEGVRMTISETILLLTLIVQIIALVYNISNKKKK